MVLSGRCLTSAPSVSPGCSPSIAPTGEKSAEAAAAPCSSQLLAFMEPAGCLTTKQAPWAPVPEFYIASLRATSLPPLERPSLEQPALTACFLRAIPTCRRKRAPLRAILPPPIRDLRGKRRHRRVGSDSNYCFASHGSRPGHGRLRRQPPVDC